MIQTAIPVVLLFRKKMAFEPLAMKLVLYDRPWYDWPW
jgi:hypothetical protein